MFALISIFKLILLFWIVYDLAKNVSSMPLSFFAGKNMDFSQDVAVLILMYYPKNVLILGNVLYSDTILLENILQVNAIVVYACEIAIFYLQGKSAGGKCSL